MYKSALNEAFKGFVQIKTLTENTQKERENSDR
jgi:hypothetical protein